MVPKRYTVHVDRRNLLFTFFPSKRSEDYKTINIHSVMLEISTYVHVTHIIYMHY